MTEARETIARLTTGREVVTGSKVAALAVIGVGIAAGVGGGLWHLYVTHQIPALADHSIPSTTRDRTGPQQNADRAAAPTVQALQEASRAPGSLPAAGAPPSPVPDGKTPSFDVVRVEPQGDAVVAGKGAPNAKVALLSGGKVVGEATSDAAGQFVILPERLAPGDHALTLRQTPDGKPASESSQSVAVSVPGPGKGKVVVALAEPGKATKLLSPPPGAAAGAPALAGPVDKVIVRSAELENGSGLYVSGAAHPGTSVHVYLNDSHIADVVAGGDGAWSVRVKHGLTGGHYRVRADAGGADGKVASRAEVPFDVPTVMADAGKSPVAPPSPTVVASATPGAPASSDAAPKPAGALPTPGDAAAPHTVTAGHAAPEAGGATAPDSTAPKAGGADATIESIATARVTQGDNLWNISRFRLGDGLRYTQIYAANSEQIRDPNLIYPGQVFVVPQH